jgi:excinuclease ABC subunit C
VAGKESITPVLEALQARLPGVPTGPGVYLLRNMQRRVIYVGKAVNLRARLRSYLRGGDERSQIRFLVGHLADFETVVTATEKEALILENNLIKQYRPRYNIRLKDDKSYVSVKVTVQDPWPRVLVTRRVVRDGSHYLGPFHDAGAVRDALDTVRKVFPLRTCSDTVFRNRSRPCIEYDINRCLAPCVLPVDRDVYDEHLRQATLLIRGRSREVAERLEARMQEAASAERYEEAGRLRDQIRAIAKTQERQQAVTHWGADQDVFGLYREGGAIQVQVLFVRDGKLMGTQAYAFDDWEFADAEVMEAMLTQFYQASMHDVPDEILLPVAIGDAAVRADYLSDRRGRRMAILVPRRGDKRRLVDMAQGNARQSFADQRSASGHADRQVAELQRRLRLREPPRRIECLDIATFQGGETVGAVVAFVDAEPWKDGYRRYRIRSVEGTDDFASVAEVLSRRFRRQDQPGELPDLLVIDGGAGQLAAARAALADVGLSELPVVGLAKERLLRDATATELQRRPERVFVPGRKNPIVLRSNSTALFLLQRVRDEAHRFANDYHRSLRSKHRLASPLDEIEGVGPSRRRSLLRAFQSVAGIRRASLEDVAAVSGIGPQLAERIKEHLTTRS